MTARDDTVTAHYGGGGLIGRIREALEAVGLDPEAVTPKDLAPVDEFHSRGRQATRELAELAAPADHEHVLDVGSGVGGQARYLASTYGCRVTGVDLTASFCETATWLNVLTGLEDLVTFRQGSGTDLPFPDGAFDLAWTIQMQMNIEDKARLYSEIHRVLRPGGRYVLQELCAGDGGPCHLPAPWADRDEISFLLAPDALRETVEAAGLEATEWRHTTAEAMAWYQEQNAKADAGASPLGIHIVMGANAKDKRANVERNYREGRLRQVMGAFSRP